MSIALPRRAFLSGIASLCAAPAIVKASSLMPVRSVITAVPSAVIDDGREFLMSLFAMLADYPNMTATEVVRAMQRCSSRPPQVA